MFRASGSGLGHVGAVGFWMLLASYAYFAFTGVLQV